VGPRSSKEEASEKNTNDLRKRILELTQREVQELGIKKSTLHYLRKNAGKDGRFKVYQKVAYRLC